MDELGAPKNVDEALMELPGGDPLRASATNLNVALRACVSLIFSFVEFTEAIIAWFELVDCFGKGRAPFQN